MWIWLAIAGVIVIVWVKYKDKIIEAIPFLAKLEGK